MRFRRTRDISVTSLVKFDGWDVFLGGALAVLIIRYTVHGTPGYLTVVWIGLLVVWIVMTFLVNLGIVPPGRGHGRSGGASHSGESGGASAAGGASPPGKAH